MTKNEYREKLKEEFREIYKKKNNISVLTGDKNYQQELRVYINQRMKEEYISEENQNKLKKIENGQIIELKIADEFVQDKIKFYKKQIEKNLKNYELFYAHERLTLSNIDEFFNEIDSIPGVFIGNLAYDYPNNYIIEDAISDIKSDIYIETKRLNNDLEFFINKNGKYIEYRYDNTALIGQIREKIVKGITSEIIYDCLEKNQYYVGFRKMSQTKQSVVEEIPENFIDLYPNARSINRKWYLHIGPTNSGKTYESLEKLKTVKQGLYLAPLRLLALEVQERMLESSVLCNLTTGEEEDIIECATHCSSTIEKLNINKYYDLCVIDEAQMISDKDRGWAWTRAILGVFADEVHVCMSQDAEKIVCKLIKECGEEYEIIRHERNTELIFENEGFNFPSDVRDNDALVVFSRKNVLMVATELEKKGHKVSVLYGNLPYKVRKEELRKFRDGETKVLVTTDCIGMGMNINVERVVFLSSTKFDGTQNRTLNVSEVKQIARRAGRMGMFDVGYVNAMEDRKLLKKIFNKEYDDILKAKINFPETLLGIDDKLSNILVCWSKLQDKDIFVKTNVARDLSLCRTLEKHDLSKEQMLKFINIPFDERNSYLYDLWQKLIIKYCNNSFNIDYFLRTITVNNDLENLELSYKKLDLMFSFLKAIGEVNPESFSKINKLKEEVSDKLIEELKKKKNFYKHCKVCGKQMAWNYPYGMCEKCYNKQYSHYYDDDYYW